MFRDSAILSGVLVAGMVWQAPAGQDLAPETFNQLHRLIKPRPGESRWMEIPWLIDLHAARKKAAAEGKPICVMSGGGATAIGPC
jgi:hypothetical protein